MAISNDTDLIENIKPVENAMLSGKDQAMDNVKPCDNVKLLDKVKPADRVKLLDNSRC